MRGVSRGGGSSMEDDREEGLFMDWVTKTLSRGVVVDLTVRSSEIEKVASEASAAPLKDDVPTSEFI